VFYRWLPSPDIAVARVKRRGKAHGAGQREAIVVDGVRWALMQVVAMDTSLEDRLHLLDVIRRQVTGLVKLDLAAGVVEHAVEDDEVVMRVDVDRALEAQDLTMRERHAIRSRNAASSMKHGAAGATVGRPSRGA